MIARILEHMGGLMENRTIFYAPDDDGLEHLLIIVLGVCFFNVLLCQRLGEKEPSF